VSEPRPSHTPVLPAQVMELLSPAAGETVVDCTVGAGGHALLLAEAIGVEGRLIGIDADPTSIEQARSTLSGALCRVDLVHAGFGDVGEVLAGLGVERADVMLADLGLCSTQLDDRSRGFSFMGDGPLDMRMNPDLERTAADIVNELKERDLADLIYHNAQERASRRIAKAICFVRREGRITTTAQLVRVVASALRVDPNSRKSKIHPATRTFQALRMAVNDEVTELATLLATAPKVLAVGGRFGVIAFHSVEDKPVKQDFRTRGGEGVYRIITKRPVSADDAERLANPRSRSAKFRVVERLPDDQVRR